MRAQLRIPVVAVAAVLSALATGMMIQVTGLKLNWRKVSLGMYGTPSTAEADADIIARLEEEEQDLQEALGRSMLESHGESDAYPDNIDDLYLAQAIQATLEDDKREADLLERQEQELAIAQVEEQIKREEKERQENIDAVAQFIEEEQKNQRAVAAAEKITAKDLTDTVVDELSTTTASFRQMMFNDKAKALGLAGIWEQPGDNSCMFHALRQDIMAAERSEGRRTIVTVRDLRVVLRDWCVPVMSVIMGSSEFAKMDVKDGCAGFIGKMVDQDSWGNSAALSTFANVLGKKIIVLNHSDGKENEFIPQNHVRKRLGLVDVEGLDDIQTIVLDSDFKRVEVEDGRFVDVGHFNLWANTKLLNHGAYEEDALDIDQLQRRESTRLVIEAVPDEFKSATPASFQWLSSLWRPIQLLLER